MVAKTKLICLLPLKLYIQFSDKILTLETALHRALLGWPLLGLEEKALLIQTTQHNPSTHFFRVFHCKMTNLIQLFFDLSMFDFSKIFTLLKILVHKTFELSKNFRGTIFDLSKENCGFWGKEGNPLSKLGLKSKYCTWNLHILSN